MWPHHKMPHPIHCSNADIFRYYFIAAPCSSPASSLRQHCLPAPHHVCHHGRLLLLLEHHAGLCPRGPDGGGVLLPGVGPAHVCTGGGTWSLELGQPNNMSQCLGITKFVTPCYFPFVLSISSFVDEVGRGHPPHKLTFPADLVIPSLYQILQLSLWATIQFDIFRLKSARISFKKLSPNPPESLYHAGILDQLGKNGWADATTCAVQLTRQANSVHVSLDGLSCAVGGPSQLLSRVRWNVFSFLLLVTCVSFSIWHSASQRF